MNGESASIVWPTLGSRIAMWNRVELLSQPLGLVLMKFRLSDLCTNGNYTVETGQTGDLFSGHSTHHNRFR